MIEKQCANIFLMTENNTMHNATMHKATPIITMDTMYLSVHVCVSKQIVALMSSRINSVANICNSLDVETLTLTAFIDTECHKRNESVFIELNCRACLDGDFSLLKKPPLCSELFIATILDTTRIRVAHVTPFNVKKAETMGWIP